MATYVGFFSNIKSGSFKWTSALGEEDSMPLDESVNDGVWYKIAGYPYSYLHKNGIVANEPEGYRFVGWYTLSKNFTTKSWGAITRSMLSPAAISTSKSFVPSSSQLKTFLEWSSRTQYYFLYAEYDNTFLISFDKKGGAGGNNDIMATYGQALPTITIPSKAGYTFAGYFDTDSGTGGVQYYSSSGEGVRNWDKSSNTTLYARWIGNELVCTYNPNGGFCDRYFDRVRAGGVFPALPTAIWDTDTTSRWYTAITGGTEIHQGDMVTQVDDFMLYAHWNKTETCTVTFNAGGGTSSETQRTVNKGAVIGTLPTATWTGHTFKGWFLSSGGGTAITSAYIVDDDIYLYAQWDSNTYTVTFNGNGGTPSQSTKSVAYESQYGTLPYCEQTGKTFLGWFTSATGGTKVEATTIFQQQSNQTLYAHWSDVDPAVKWYYLASPA